MVKAPRRDRWGRALGVLLIEGEDAAAIMVAAGLALPYDGRTARRGWCPP
jgi:endonuclease YncB( thermonuclease family)